MSKLLSVIFLLCVLTFSNCLSNLLRKSVSDSENDNESISESEESEFSKACPYKYHRPSKCLDGTYLCCSYSEKCRRSMRYGEYVNFCA